MKPWAERFYKSQTWVECRLAFLKSKFYICERCRGTADVVHHKLYLTPNNINNPEITLNWDNLEALCRDCHHKEHHVRFNPIADKSLMFDDEGNIVRKAEISTRKVIVVAGPPLAGKTTYVLEQMERGDLMVDLDYIFSAVSGLSLHDKPVPLLRTVFDIREALYEHIECRRGDWSRAWVVATVPERRAREELTKRLRAELVLLVPPKEECLIRLEASARPDKAEQVPIVNEWFDRFEP